MFYNAAMQFLECFNAVPKVFLVFRVALRFLGCLSVSRMLPRVFWVFYSVALWVLMRSF